MLLQTKCLTITSPYFTRIEAIQRQLELRTIVHSIFCKTPSYNLHLYIAFKLQPLFGKFIYLFQQLKQPFFMRQSKTLQDIISTNIFVVKRIEKVFPKEVVVNSNPFLHLRINALNKYQFCHQKKYHIQKTSTIRATLHKYNYHEPKNCFTCKKRVNVFGAVSKNELI